MKKTSRKERRNLLELGKHLRSVRQSRGILLRKVCCELGVRADTISFWERGVVAPKEELIKRYCDTLGVDYDAFVERDTDIDCGIVI